MAHFLFPLRPPTKPESDAFAFPKEQGISKSHHDPWSISVGARLIAKCPFSAGDMLCLENEEFVVVEKHKGDNSFVIKLRRDPRIKMEATADELDAHFYLCPGEESPVNSFDIKKLLGKQEVKEDDEEPKKKEKDVKESVDEVKPAVSPERQKAYDIIYKGLWTPPDRSEVHLGGQVWPGSGIEDRDTRSRIAATLSAKDPIAAGDIYDALKDNSDMDDDSIDGYTEDLMYALSKAGINVNLSA